MGQFSATACLAMVNEENAKRFAWCVTHNNNLYSL